MDIKKQNKYEMFMFVHKIYQMPGQIGNKIGIMIRQTFQEIGKPVQSG